MGYVKLVPLLNKVSVPDVIKLLRSCLCAPGQSNCDTRRPDEASSVDEAVGHLNRILGTAKHPLILQQQCIKVKILRSHLDMDGWMFFDAFKLDENCCLSHIWLTHFSADEREVMLGSVQIRVQDDD